MFAGAGTAFYHRAKIIALLSNIARGPAQGPDLERQAGELYEMAGGETAAVRKVEQGAKYLNKYNFKDEGERLEEFSRTVKQVARSRSASPGDYGEGPSGLSRAPVSEAPTSSKAEGKKWHSKHGRSKTGSPKIRRK